jgi:hypothetical protein
MRTVGAAFERPRDGFLIYTAANKLFQRNERRLAKLGISDLVMRSAGIMNQLYFATKRNIRSC